MSTYSNLVILIHKYVTNESETIKLLRGARMLTHFRNRNIRNARHPSPPLPLLKIELLTAETLGVCNDINAYRLLKMLCSLQKRQT